MTDEEPLAQWLNNIFKRSDDLLVEANRPAYRFLSKEEMLEAMELGPDDIYLMAQIATRFQLIASNIDSRKLPKLTMVRNNG